jgi:RimJ/RimL family protein N-acetyltransferase
MIVPKTMMRRLSGQLIDLVPMESAHTSDIVRMRNQPHVREFFDEKTPTTEASQTVFFAAYANRPDDLYWCMALKNGTIIGTDRLNEIDGSSGHKGSMIVDEAYTNRGPYALESGLMMLNFAFKDLGLQRIRAAIHPTNVKAISFNKHLGFQLTGHCDVRGVAHEEYVVTSADFHPEKFADLIGYFAQRPQ